jgi:hypothetical protein
MAESGATVLTNVSSMPTLFDAIQRPSTSALTSLNATSPTSHAPSSPTTTTPSGSTTSPRTSQSASNLPSPSTSRSTLSSYFSSPRGVTIQDPSVQITDDREINLSGRGQTKFPSIQLKGFQKLKKLNLSQNQIREITEQDIRNLVPKPAKSLTLLDLSHNQLNRLPTQISLLLTLRKLYLQHNRLTSIPSEIVGCVHLRSVNLSDNLLESLPCEIMQLYSLKKLQLSGNPLQDPPLAICNRGVKEIFTYFNLKNASTSFSAGGPKSLSSTDLRKPGRLSLNMSRFSSKHFGSSGNVSLNSPTSSSSSDSSSNDSETYHFGDESGEVEEFSEKLLLSHFAQLDSYCQSFGFTLYPDNSGDGYNSSNIKDLKKKFKNNRKHQQKAFLSWIQKFLRLPGVYNFNWAEIFHRRLLFTHTILLGRQLVVYRNLIRYFLEGASKDLTSISERVKKIYQKLGDDLAGFLETHQQDPDGALIGLQPNENLVRSFLSYISGGTVTGSSQNLVKFMKPSENEYTREKLVQKILLWSQMSDLEVIGKQVIVFADVLKAADVFNLQKGDLVIAKLNADEGGRILFARLVNMNTASNTAKIVYSPNEKSVSVISTSNLLPVSSELKLRMEDTRSMQKLTHDGIDELYKQLKTEINERLKK